LHFLLGYKSGEYRAHALVATYSVGANYNPEDPDKSILTDWAILTLTAPIATLTTPLQLARKPPAAGEQIMVGGFSQRHPFKMTADTDCRVRGVLPNGLVGHDCAVMRGLSGAPLLKSKANSRTEIVGLHVATGKSMGSSVGLAVPVATFARQAFAPEH
jgi:protease YdgD